MRRHWLPSRSFALAGPRGGGALLAVLLAIAGAFGYAAWDALSDLRRVQHEQRVWDTGVVGERSVVTVREDSRLAVTSHLDVGYADSDGVYQTHELAFSLLGLGVDARRAAIVHYVPGDPSDFAVDWALAVRDARWRYSVIGGGVFAFGGLLPLAAVVVVLGRRLRRRSIARSGDEIEATIVSVRQRTGRQQHLIDVAWRVDVSAKPVIITVIDTRGGTIAWLPGRSSALALVNADRTDGILLRSDLDPLRLRPDERTNVLAALTAAGALVPS